MPLYSEDILNVLHQQKDFLVEFDAPLEIYIANPKSLKPHFKPLKLKLTKEVSDFYIH